jgi:enoyl-CoA hydratase
MTYEHILIDAEDGVGIVTLNRPDKLNAMNRQLSSDLHDAVKRMDADEAIGCIVITGAGDRAFSAGGDIHEQREDDRRYTQEELDAHRPPRRGGYEIASCAKPTIGMINGLAYGGAAVLASSLDMRVGCEDSRFRFLAAAYGRINSTWTLPNQVGWPIAKELLFSARIVEADEAYRIGLLNHLVPREQLRSKTMELARTIAGNNRASALLLEHMGQNLEHNGPRSGITRRTSSEAPTRRRPSPNSSPAEADLFRRDTQTPAVPGEEKCHCPHRAASSSPRISASAAA